MKHAISIFGVALAVSVGTAAPLAAQTLVSWASALNADPTSAGRLTKTGGCDGCFDAGAHGAASIAGDGYLQFVPAGGHRLVAGLSATVTPALSTTIDFSFSIWPGGVWEIRERGVYRTEGTFIAGDRFAVSVESATVVYRLNGLVVYQSAAPPAGSLTPDVLLSSAGASLSETMTGAAPGPWPPAPPAPPPSAPTPAVPVVDLPTGVVSSGPYRAVIDRLPHAKPPVPSLGPAGSVITDPVFQSRITRVTDNVTRPGALDRSFRTPSSPHQNAWSANGSYFYVVSGDGTVIPFAFDASNGAAHRLQPTATGDGGLVLHFYIEPQFSYVNDSIVYGSLAGGVNGATLHSIDQYDFSTGAYTRLLDLEPLVPGLAGTYIGGLGSSAGPTERIMAFFGGKAQDYHHDVVVFDKANPQNRFVLDTLGNTLNGAPTSMALSFSLHHAAIDRSGRYVMLYPTWADQSSARKAAQSYLWDTATGTFTEMGVSARPYGHDSFGYGMSVNQDCCVATRYDAAQWQMRALAAPLATADVIKNVLPIKEIYLADHTTWNNARPDRMVPFVSGLFRSPASTTDWRAWDDEIVAVQTDTPSNQDATVWRFAHHRSDIRSDLDATQGSFWYQPRPNVSPDGRWVLFTSNWEKTLGTDPAGEPGTGARQDVFLVALASSATPVTLSTASLPAGRAAVSYSGAPTAAGGSGHYAWMITAGTLPNGLTLDAATGAIVGAPQATGAFSFTVTIADAADATNTASAPGSIAIGLPPVFVTTASLTAGRERVAYSTTLRASGGSGAVKWTLASGALPAGLTLNASTGVIAGVPAAPGTYTVAVSATDVGDATNVATASYTLALAPGIAVSSPRNIPSATAGQPYSYQALAGNVQGTAIWNLQGGALPAGMTLSPTGLVSGTCTTPGTYYFNARVRDANTDDTLTLTLVVR